ALAMDPGDHWRWCMAATLLARAGDFEGYQNHCRAMLSRFRSTDWPSAANNVAEAASLLPDAGADLEVASRLSEMAVASATNTNYWWIASPARYTRALTEYRLGRFASATQWVSQALVKAG